MLYNVAIAIQHNDFTGIEETENVFERVKEVLDVFAEHAKHEDQFILPAINKFDRELVAEFEVEHQVEQSLADGLRNVMIVHSRLLSESAKREAGESICRAFNEFIAFSLYHMNKEEDKLNKVLWAHFTDSEIIGLQNAIFAAVSPALILMAGSWIMRGINNAEVIQWLICVKNNAPDQLFEALVGLAETELPAERWQKILEQICEGAMVA
jgi:hypothetical protein